MGSWVQPSPMPVATGDVGFSSNLGVPNSFLGSAEAGPGILRAAGFARIQSIPAQWNNVHAVASASFELNDVIVTGPGGVTSVDAAANVVINGLIGVGGFPGPSPPPGGGAIVSFSIHFFGVVTGAGTIGIDSSADPIATATGLLDSGGLDGPPLIGGRSYGKIITSGVGAFSTVSPNTVKVVIGTGASAGSNGGALGNFSEGVSNFGSTVHFPRTGPVFNLPDGFTANSISGHIVNNQWTGVPEPGGIVLAVSCFMGLAGIRRTQRRRD